MIWIRLHHDKKTGRDFRGVYHNGKQVAAYWDLESALAHAEGLSDLTGAAIWSAPVLPFAKRGAA